ncbi:multidrug resistance protein B [Mycobacterium botniense]|uniref:Multidrug resistance protein B n=1 Tax=Mycobacterium botniense TaxID=84962 RepID=A0A7I9XX51_9MYCO|nr:multidrug resistance protein B [Mycobacterium botniense]
MGERIYPDKLDAGLLRVAGVCVLAVVMTILDTTVVGVAQRTFITVFESSQAVVAWTMAGYTLALATVIPLAGWAADRFGTKRLFMSSVLAFTVGSLLCATAPNILVLIVFRVVQGLGGGMLMPLTITILTREAGPKRIGRLMAVLGIPMLLAPIAGPILGGWLIDAYGWQWIFRINLPIGMVAFILAAIVFPKDRATPSETFDVAGLLLLSPGLAAFLYGISSIPARGLVIDPHVWIPASIGLILIGSFVLHALRTSNPLIDLRLFKNREVTAANLTMLLSGAAFFGAALLIPSCLQQLLHQTPLQSGVHMMPERIGAMLTMPIAGVLLDRRGPDKVVLTGITLIGAGMATFAYGVAAQVGYLPVLLAGLVLMGMGLGCTTMPLTAAAVQSLAPHQIARGSALINVNLQVAASISTALMSVILTSQFDHSKNIAAARKAGILQPGRRDLIPDPALMPRSTAVSDFMSNVLRDLSHAYTAVFVAAVVLAVLALIPAMFLPKKPVAPGPGQVAVVAP